MITIIMIIFWEALKFRKLHLHRNLQRILFLIHPEEIQIRRIKMRNQILSEKKKLLQACQSCEKYF